MKRFIKRPARGKVKTFITAGGDSSGAHPLKKGISQLFNKRTSFLITGEKYKKEEEDVLNF